MTKDHYAGAGQRWAAGATLVYGPIARQLVARASRSLAGCVVLDAGAGTGVASTALFAVGARPVAMDLSHDMLAYGAASRPPAAVADVRALPLADETVDHAVAAFVLNHLVDPERGIAELGRVTRRGGAVLACVFSNSSHSEARDVVDATAMQHGWQVPHWYTKLKTQATPLLGSAEGMRTVAARAGLADVIADEVAVDVGVTQAEQLVDYRLGQAHFTEWLARVDPAFVKKVRGNAIEAVMPLMRPYQPVVVFLTATVLVRRANRA